MIVAKYKLKISLLQKYPIILFWFLKRIQDHVLNNLFFYKGSENSVTLSRNYYEVKISLSLCGIT